MVVVDNARRMIGKNADIAVTSVLQTTAGKMIFGRLWEDAENGGPVQAHAGGGGGGQQRRSFQQRQQHQQHAPVRGTEPAGPGE
jgi:hypothetical protein